MKIFDILMLVVSLFELILVLRLKRENCTVNQTNVVCF